MQQRYLGRIEPDEGVCDDHGDTVGTAARLYRHDPAEYVLEPPSPEPGPPDPMPDPVPGPPGPEPPEPIEALPASRRRRDR